MTDKEKLIQIERIIEEYDSWKEGTGSLSPYKVVDKVKATLAGEKKLTITYSEYMAKVNSRNTNMLVNIKE